MKTPQNIQPSFDDEISVADIIGFFKPHKKMILICVLLGGILGGLFVINTKPMYRGSVLIMPASVAGETVLDPKITLSKLDMNSYYSKETFLSCNPDFYKDKDKDKDFDYKMSSIIKASITKDNVLIELSMTQKNKAVIKDCLDHIINDIRQNQNSIASPLIESKKIEMNLIEEKIKMSEDFISKLNEKQTNGLKTNNEQHITADLLSANMLMINSNRIEELMDQLNKIKTELSSVQSRKADIVLPINIEKESSLSLKFGILLGLFLGFALGLFISLVRQIKV